MKRIAYFLTMAAVALVSCQPADKTFPDVRSFGLSGDVKEVYASTMDPELEAEGEDPMLEPEILEFSFDELGRVTEDNSGNSFEYDAQGNLVSEYQELSRDDKGRIVKFTHNVLDDEGQLLDENLDVLDYCEIEYSYDGQGRMIKEKYDGWEWSATYTFEYEGNNIYPSKVSMKGSGEGWIDEVTTTYEYLTFDDKGNWTSRNVDQVRKSYEEPWEENPEPEVETTEIINRQLRRITYWSE